MKVLEAVLVAVMSGVMAFLMIYFMDDCRGKSDDAHGPYSNIQVG